jgi:restriction endonuclease S subunit
MKHLFTHGTKGEPTKQTEIGEMPESWQAIRLGDICIIATGTTPSTDQLSYYQGKIPFVKTSEIANSKINASEVHISEEAIRDYNLKIYPPSTIFLAMYGQGKTRGQVSILEISAATTQNTAAIIPNNELEPEYTWQWLMSQYNNLREAGSQGQISHLNLGYVKQYKIALPSRVEQHIISTILNACDAKIAALEHEIELHDELFRAVLEELMTGRLSARGLIEKASP